MASSTLSPPVPPAKPRPGGIGRALTAPEKMAVNGHFASAGQDGQGNFEHGIQVIDEDKEFKFVLFQRSWADEVLSDLSLTPLTVQIFRSTSNSPVSLPLVSIIT